MWTRIPATVLFPKKFRTCFILNKIKTRIPDCQHHDQSCAHHAQAFVEKGCPGAENHPKTSACQKETPPGEEKATFAHSKCTSRIEEGVGHPTTVRVGGGVV